jgi:predicted GIY-YIG superfamily endonuclease
MWPELFGRRAPHLDLLILPLAANIPRMTQILLIRDPSPLVERLGRDFFRRLPESPGVYLMRGQADQMLYVGKARNLRRRLAHYRVANPDRMPRRHLRLLRAVERIEIEQCADEAAALEREAHLLRTFKPRFNRAGTWPGPTRYLAFKPAPAALQLAVTPTPQSDWQSHGPMGSGARHVRTALVRLLWSANFPGRGLSQMPAGWFRGDYGDVVTLDFSATQSRITQDLAGSLGALFLGNPEKFKMWISQTLPSDVPLFDKAILEADLEFVSESFAHRRT